MNMLDKAEAMKLRTKQFAIRVVGGCEVVTPDSGRGRDREAITSLRYGRRGKLPGGLQGTVTR
jgi:hypothetical protein